MNRQERIEAHDVPLDQMYLPSPQAHMRNARDNAHYEIALDVLRTAEAKTALDVGCYDGWLPFLLMDQGFRITGVELIKSLAEAARRYADRNFYPLEVHQGFFDELEFKDTYDAGMCFETLEHVDLDIAQQYVEKLETLCRKSVVISLPDQKHDDNPQHLWTPTEQLIKELWGSKSDFKMWRIDYPKTEIPANWFFVFRPGLR